MRVGIDATVLAQPHTTGIARLIRSLVTALAETDADCEFTLLYRLRSLKYARRIWKPADSRFRVAFLGRLLEPLVLSRLDVFHSTYQRLPAYQGTTPYLGTLHDIFFASHGHTVDAETSRRWVARYRDVVQRCRLVMTLSEYSKREIVGRLGAEPARVRIVLPAAAPAFHRRSTDTIAAVRRRHRLECPYILFVGGFDPRKNAVAALRAFTRSVARLPPEICMVITGNRNGENEARAKAEVPPALWNRRVRRVGFVPDDDFAALMSGSLFVLFPTLFEGFGLPALEAMACGAPVLTSSTTSLPEVCGDAALLVDPSDAQALAEGLVHLASDPALRQRLQDRGAERATQFSWSQAAQHTLALYREVAGDRGTTTRSR